MCSDKHQVLLPQAPAAHVLLLDTERAHEAQTVEVNGLCAGKQETSLLFNCLLRSGNSCRASSSTAPSGRPACCQTWPLLLRTGRRAAGSPASGLKTQDVSWLRLTGLMRRYLTFILQSDPVPDFKNILWGDIPFSEFLHPFKPDREPTRLINCNKNHKGELLSSWRRKWFFKLSLMG